MTKIDNAVDTYTQLGKSFGDVSRTVIGFTKNHSDGGRRRRNPQTPKMLMGDVHFEFDLDE